MALLFQIPGLTSCSRAGDEAVSDSGPGPERFRIFEPEGASVVLDPSRFPRTLNEAPILAEQVRQNLLPPVRQRVGQDPLFLEPLNEIGKYGGTLRRAYIGAGDFNGVVRVLSGPDSLLYWDYEWKTVTPNIARGYELSRDERALTLFLRRGMRWSDGAPFTAADILFWYNDMYLDRRIVAESSQDLQVAGSAITIERVDDYTVQFVAQKPLSILVELLASFSEISIPSYYARSGMGGYAPRHYLSRFHPKYSSEQALNREAQEKGFPNWAIYLKNRNDWNLNVDLPVVTPWRVVTPINTKNFSLERNPYSIWFDSAGNQLPYIDQVAHVLCESPDVVTFKAMTGAIDFQSRHLDVQSLPFLIRNQARAEYKVYLNPSQVSDLGIRVNLSYAKDPEIGALLGDVNFRRALSLAIDREEINETFMLGQGLPTASVPAPENRFYPGDEWAQRWAYFDPERANRMLDGIGLSARDAQGYRLRRDGGGRLRLHCQSIQAHFNWTGVAEMVKEQWSAVGVFLVVNIVEPMLSLQQSMAGEVQLSLQSAGSADPFIVPYYLFPFTPFGVGGIAGVEYARWFQTGGADGVRPPDEIVEIMDMWRAGRTMPNRERVEIGREMIRRHVDLAMSIGLVSRGFTYYGVHVRNEALENVPRRFTNTLLVSSPANAHQMTFFYKDEARRSTNI